MTPPDAERYRRKADERYTNAKTVTDDADRAAWLRLAEVWTELARSANRDGIATGYEFWQQAKQELTAKRE